MMMEHKLKKILQLVTGDQEGTEDSETMPNKEDIERNVEEILKMLHAEVNDPTSSDKSSDKSELASRIDNFHKGFQAVHGRYDHLMGELKKILQPICSDNGNCSCDLKSDAALNEVSDEREELKKDGVSFEEHQTLQSQLDDMKRRNDKLETLCQERKNIAEQFAEKIEVLTRDLDASLNSQRETNLMLRSLHAENEILSSDNAEASSRMLEAKKHIEELIYLESVLTERKRKESGLIYQLKREKEVLRSGNIELINRIQKAEKAVADVRERADLELKLVHEEMRSQNSKLKAMEDLRAESGLLRDENSKLRSSNNNLNQEFEAKVAENEALASEIRTLKDDYSNSLVDYERMNLELELKHILCLEEISDLKAELTDLKTDHSRLVPDTGKLVSENSTKKIVDKLEEELRNCMLDEGETATLNLQIQTREDELTSTEGISKKMEERNTLTIEEEVLKLEVEIAGLCKAFSELEAVFEENSGRIQEQISVFSEKRKELKNLSAKYRELAEKDKELADEYKKKREATREMSLKINHLCTFLSSLQT